MKTKPENVEITMNQFVEPSSATRTEIIDRAIAFAYREAFRRAEEEINKTQFGRDSTQRNENVETISQHTFCFNPNDTEGEQLSVTIEVVDGCPYVDIELMSYFNIASIYTSLITPDKLRKLADEMDIFLKSTMRKETE